VPGTVTEEDLKAKVGGDLFAVAPVGKVLCVVCYAGRQIRYASKRHTADDRAKNTGAQAQLKLFCVTHS
jgi:hypothetical protein